MVIALICVISGAALAQFLLFYWRATISVVASAPLSPRVREAAGIQGDAFTGRDFGTVLYLHEICPDLKSAGAGVALVQCYYYMVRGLERLGGSLLQGWASQELATCSRYVAARIDQRIASNRAVLSHVHAN
jgi:hypothetical protein